MTTTVRRLITLLVTLASALGLVAAASGPAAAQGLFDQPKYASIVVDANTGEVMYALRADQRRFPASITKVMTLYLTFEALATGRLTMDERVPFSAHAAAQAPSKLGVPVGDSISVREAILGITVKSANDAASALAEKVGGTEQRFAELMTLRAQELGMKGTTYVNANGLPDARQVSTARDIAVLARAVMRDYPQYYGFFNAGSMSWQGHEVYNRHSFLKTIPGVDGLKTGYTNAAGHNLVASAVRDGRRLITVVLGGTSTATRDENVENLFDAGFSVLRKRALGERVTLAALMHEPDDMSGPMVRPPYEMGAGDQQQLKVVVADPLKLGYATPAPRPTPVKANLVAKADDEPVCSKVKVRGRHHRLKTEVRCVAPKAGRVHTVLATAPEAADCAALHGRKLHACRREAKADAAQVARIAPEAPDCRKLKGRKLHACRRKSDAQEAQLAKADAPCAKLHGRKLKACLSKADADAGQVAKATLRDCGKTRHRHHAKACDADASDDVVSAKDAGGGYMIQVGAFPSRTAARNKLTKLASLAGGSARVEGGGRAFRARFSGYSASAARAACGKLSARGEACLVVAPG